VTRELAESAIVLLDAMLPTDALDGPPEPAALALV
jgi:hypothetical protein